MLDIIKRIKDSENRINIPEDALGKGLMQPFNGMNSASRKIMFGTQLEQILGIFNPEPPLIQTGYEDEFGRHSTSIIQSDDDYEVIAKIPKFTFIPNHSYVSILKSKYRNYYTVIERKFCTHITETYGYLMNNNYIDSTPVGGVIKQGDIITKSNSYTKYNNRQDGVNLNTVYMTPHKTTEDGILVSESAAKKMVSPLFKKIMIVINDNDIPLNLYGNETIYKSFPDIGETISNGILCSTRRENKEESLFSLSWDRLRDIMISDEKFIAKGQVIDIDIACNNIKGLDSFYNVQLKKYYNELMIYASNIVNQLKYIVNNPEFESSYELKKMYMHYNNILSGKKWINRNPFSNVVLEILVMEIDELEQGDKLSDRYGGKGVVSSILPDEEMPILPNGDRVEIIFNGIGPVGRENPGQLLELSLNFIGDRIIEEGYNLQDTDEFINLYLDYIGIISPKKHAYFKSVIDKLDDKDKYLYIESLCDGINLSIEPISETIDIDKLDQIYKKLLWIHPSHIQVPIKDSNGNIRYVESRRPLTYGKKYTYRLKQYAEDNFSATSLSSTNIKNEPVKSKTNTIHKSPYAKTPVKFGEMETGNMLHFLNPYPVVSNLMLHSTSPKGRRLAENLLTDNPFDVNVDLTDDAVNRNVEILNTYLKTIGLRLVFTKKKKQAVIPISFNPISFTSNPNKTVFPISYRDRIIPIKFIDKNKITNPISFNPIRWIKK